MKLIYYHGLNCHLACIINIVASMGLNYKDAYSTLWSECDFQYNPQYCIYLSQRVFDNLEQLGIEILTLKCNDPKGASEILEMIPNECLFLVGMDTFYIPWSPVYQGFHTPHYFNVRKRSKDDLISFDPIYNKVCMEIKYTDIINHGFEIIQVSKKHERILQSEVIKEAEMILVQHPELKKNFWMEIQKCIDGDDGHITNLILLITAMINNRYLFQHYLNHCLYNKINQRQLFTDSFFQKWEAIKNGLYKIKILKDKRDIIDEVSSRYLNLMDEEITMAEDILQLKNPLLKDNS